MEGRKTTLLQDRIAALVHAHFDALPVRCKPYTRNDGSKEWIPMSGFVLVRGVCAPIVWMKFGVGRLRCIKWL